MEEPRTSGQSALRVTTANKKKPREKQVCPVCDVAVVHVPRHLRQTHLFSIAESRMYRETYKLAKSYGRHNECPVPQCGFRTARIDKHLKRGHKLSSEERRIYCKIARARSSSNRKENRERVSSISYFVH